jgi:hypothetical protein
MTKLQLVMQTCPRTVLPHYTRLLTRNARHRSIMRRGNCQYCYERLSIPSIRLPVRGKDRWIGRFGWQDAHLKPKTSKTRRARFTSSKAQVWLTYRNQSIPARNRNRPVNVLNEADFKVLFEKSYLHGLAQRHALYHSGNTCRQHRQPLTWRDIRRYKSTRLCPPIQHVLEAILEVENLVSN